VFGRQHGNWGSFANILKTTPSLSFSGKESYVHLSAHLCQCEFWRGLRTELDLDIGSFLAEDAQQLGEQHQRSRYRMTYLERVSGSKRPQRPATLGQLKHSPK